MSHDLNLVETIALAEAKIIALSAEVTHEIWVDRWVWSFDVPNLFVVADRNATPTALAVLIVEQAAIHRAQHVTIWAQGALASLALRDSPTQGGVQ